jgi:hypothetical protein
MKQGPRELSGLAWGVFVSLGLLAILSVVKIVVALKLHSAAAGGGDVVGANLRRLGVQNMGYGTAGRSAPGSSRSSG